jgi:hypothetical protein
VAPQTTSRKAFGNAPGSKINDPGTIVHPITQAARPVPAASLLPTLDLDGLRLLAIGAQSEVSTVSAQYRVGTLTEDEAAAQSHQPIALIVLVATELDRRRNGS